MQRAVRRAGAFGGLLVAAASLAGIVAPFPSAAQTDATPKPAQVEREAYYTAEADGAVPATITSEFPPGIVCILVATACSTQTQPVTSPIGQVVEPVVTADTPDHQSPQPVEDGTLPVGMLGGKSRYTSYLKFVVPSDIPSGSLVDRFDLILRQEDVSYALESPAFRQAILAGLVTYQNKTPDEFTKFVGAVANDTAPLTAYAPTGVEACAVTAAWPAGESQDAATQPARDCIFGANGTYDAATGDWTFDLSLLAQAWLDGTTPNEGVYLGPIGAENLAFGDPDTSTNWQISLAGREAADAGSRPRIRYAFSEGFGDESFDLGGELTLDDGPIEEDLGVVAPLDPFPNVDDGALTGTFEPTVGPSDEVAAPPVTGRLAAESRPRTPWWLWLLLPMGLGVAYVFGRSMEQVPPPGHSGRGALTRLMATSDH